MTTHDTLIDQASAVLPGPEFPPFRAPHLPQALKSPYVPNSLYCSCGIPDRGIDAQWPRTIAEIKVTAVAVGASAATEVRDAISTCFSDRLIPSIMFTDDDDFDRRPQRRRYEEPLYVQVRRQLLTIAESVCVSFSLAFARAHCT